jgi:kinetochore protein Nuf2
VHTSPSASAPLTASKPDHEIAGCITDIGIKFSVSDLQKPNPQIIQKVFEWLAELLMNTTREVVAPAMRAAAEDMCGGGEAERIFTSDTRDLMAFFVILRKLLREVSKPNSVQSTFRNPA